MSKNSISSWRTRALVRSFSSLFLSKLAFFSLRGERYRYTKSKLRGQSIESKYNRFENVNFVLLQKQLRTVSNQSIKMIVFPSVLYLFTEKSAVNRLRGRSSVTSICLHFTGVKTKERERSLVTEECWCN